MPFFLWTEIKMFVLDNCPVCKELLGYEMGDKELKTIFKHECKIKRILAKQNFDLKTPHYNDGIVWFERLKRGSQLRRELNLRLSKPDFNTDLEIRRLLKLLHEYGVENIKNAIFIDRFSVICISHPKREPLKHLYRIRTVPTIMSPYSPYGIIRGVSKEEPEEELEKLLFHGNSLIKPREKP
jgi:hypothetical protein